MSTEIIFLILQSTFALAAFVLNMFVYKDSGTGMILFGVAMAFFAGVLVQLLIIFYRKSRKLTDKDRIKKVGVIEKKTEQRQIARAKAGYMTVKVGGYLLSMTVIILFFSQKNEAVLHLLFEVLLIAGIIFGFLYMVYMTKKEGQ